MRKGSLAVLGQSDATGNPTLDAHPARWVVLMGQWVYVPDGHTILVVPSPDHVDTPPANPENQP